MSNEKQLTPMSELIEYYDKIKNEYKDHPYTVLTLLEEKMQSLLPKEEESHIDFASSVIQHETNCSNTFAYTASKRIFNETFKTESGGKVKTFTCLFDQVEEHAKAGGCFRCMKTGMFYYVDRDVAFQDYVDHDNTDWVVARAQDGIWFYFAKMDRLNMKVELCKRWYK